MPYSNRTKPAITYSDIVEPTTAFTDRAPFEDSYLSLETSIFDLLLQEDGGYIVLSYGTNYQHRSAVNSTFTDR